MHAGDEEVETRAGSRRASFVRPLLDRRSRLRWPTRAQASDWLSAELDIEAKARSTFFLIPIGLMIGIATTYGAGFRMGLVPALVAVVPALILARRLGGRGVSTAVALVLACILSGLALAATELRWTTTTIFSGEATVRIEGRVAWRDRDDRGRMRYWVRIERTERPVLSRPPEIVSLLVSSRHEPIPVGGRFEGLVRLRAPSGPAYPGAYDFAFTPFFEGRGANGFALGPPDPPNEEAVAPTFGERLVRLRLAMSDRIREVVGGGAGAVASALITGERSGIPDDINDWLRATGLSHVLSISGLHMALVAGFAMVLVRGLLAAIPGAALVLPTKKIAAVAALIVATGYLVISGSDVATDRSYVMLAIMLAAILVDRPALTLRNVGIAAIVVMVTTPHAVVTAGFQMSFAATAALVGLYGAISRHRTRSANRSARPHPALGLFLFLGGLAASSAIAGTATAPYAAYHFQRIAPYGVIANLVALPIFSFWIMPLALIAALAMPFGLDAPFLVLIGWALDLVFAMARILAAHFPDAPSGRLTSTGLLVLTAALLLACFLASRLRWSAVPVALVGLLFLPDRSAPPELLIYEDGRELATIDTAGILQPLRQKPNDFVLDQWSRALARTVKDDKPVSASATAGEPASRSSETSPVPSAGSSQSRSAATPSRTDEDTTISANAPPSSSATAFTCNPSPMPPDDLDRRKADLDVGASTKQGFSIKTEAERIVEKAEMKPVPDKIPPNSPAHSSAPRMSEDRRPRSNSVETSADNSRAPSLQAAPARKPAPPRQLCRAITRSGLRIAWTDDHRLTGLVCDTADIAIVARAIVLRTCRSGARLVTLRTLRETGSLAITRNGADGMPTVEISIIDPDAPWNLHRRASWPEFWRNPERRDTSSAVMAAP